MPGIPTTKIPSKKVPIIPTKVSSIRISKESKPSSKIVQTFKSTSKNHTVDVINNSNDKSQLFAYLDHCRTCGWEGRFDDVDSAVTYAKGHVEL